MILSIIAYDHHTSFEPDISEFVINVIGRFVKVEGRYLILCSVKQSEDNDEIKSYYHHVLLSTIKETPILYREKEEVEEDEKNILDEIKSD